MIMGAGATTPSVSPALRVPPALPAMTNFVTK